MPIKLPNLDDRTYASLVEEARAMIPVYAPEWTNHNASDPGVTLVEMLAYVTEMLIYRLNRVTVENVVAFLNLIDAGKRKPDDYRDRARLTQEVRSVVTELRRPYRVVTLDDYKRLVLDMYSDKVARVFATVSKDTVNDKQVDFVSVYAVPVLRSTVLVKREDGYSDHSSDIRKPGHVAYGLVSLDGEYLYVGAESAFDTIRFDLHTTVSGYALEFQYSKGGDETRGDAQWASLTGGLRDLTSGWAASGLVNYAPPAAWRPAAVSGRLLYWVRVSAKKPAKEQPVASAFRVAIQSVPVLPTLDRTEPTLPDQIKKELDTRKLLTTRLKVAGPSYRKVAVRNIKLHLKEGAVEADAVKAAKEELSRFFHPLVGWRDGGGWPFGRDVYLSEVIERLAGLPDVDFVEPVEKAVQLYDLTPGIKPPHGPNLIRLKPNELVDFRIIATEIATEAASRPRGSR